jgi:diadenylate cyclase
MDTINNLIGSFGILDLIDIAVIAFVAYKMLGLIRDTRAEQLMKGLMVLVLAMVLSGVLHLYALNWILKGTMQFGVIVLVIVFQPELRRGLESMGRSKFFRPGQMDMDKEKIKETVSAIVKAVDHMSNNKIGALIIIECEIKLNDFAERGVLLNSKLSSELLINIFQKGAPLHDGATIIREDTIVAAACVLPLTKDNDLPTETGTRHRAAIGVTEVSDAFSVVVSEETGIISTAREGHLDRFLKIKTLEKRLLTLFFDNQDSNKGRAIQKRVMNMKRRKDVAK